MVDEASGARGGAFTVPETVLVQQLPDQGLLFLDLRSEEYFGLDDVGTAMYHALLAADSVEAACDSLVAEYDVAREQLLADVRAFADALVDRGLIAREAG